MVAHRVAVDLHGERLGGRHHHVRGVVRVLEVPALHVPGRAEHLPRDARDVPPAQLADREHVQALLERGVGRHPKPAVLVERVRVGAPHHDRERLHRVGAVVCEEGEVGDLPAYPTISSHDTARNAGR